MEHPTENGKQGIETRAREEGFAERFRAWTAYEGRVVCVQLKDSYAGVTGTSASLVFNKEGNLVAVPFLRGVLSVRRDGAGIRILISTPDPNPNISGMAQVLVDPTEVSFCTTVDVEEPRRIVPP